MDRDSTLQFWKERAPSFPADATQLRALNASLFPRLQLGALDDERLRASCDFLQALLDARAPTRPIDLAIRDVHDASLAAQKLRGERIVVEPATMEAGRIVGKRLHDDITATEATQRRIERLAVLETVYNDSYLGAEAIQASLWRAAEEEAWTSDNARVRADIDQAELMTLRLSVFTTNVLYVAQVSDVVERLEADRRLMGSHGSSEPAGAGPVDDIETARDRLLAAQTRGVVLVAIAVSASMLAAIGAILLTRPVLRRMESDLIEVEIARQGAPAR